MTKKCELLGGILAYTIQGVLGFSAVGSLVYKRHIERPQRPWNIWRFDVGKQLVGGFFVHFTNIAVSSLLETRDGDQCAWYFLNFFVDCTIGVLVVYMVHEAICRSAVRFSGPRSALARVGFYGDPPDVWVWATQLAVYLLSLVVNKALVGLCFWLSLGQLEDFGNWLFGPLQPYPVGELVVVMVLCPWFLTTLQFLIFDAILKADDPQSDGESDGTGLIISDTYSALGSPSKSSIIANEKV